MMNFEKQTLLSLDFWQDKVLYMGDTLPVGAIACAALNVSDETLEKLAPIAAQLDAVNGMACPTAEDWASTKDGVLEILEGLKAAPPFCYLNFEKCRKEAMDCYTKETLQGMAALSQALAQYGVLGIDPVEHEQALHFAELLLLCAMLPRDLKQYRESILPFVEALHMGGRTPEDYADAFDRFFPVLSAYDLNSTQWMGIKNISVQHIAVELPETGEKQIVMRMLCANFAGLLRQDLFEGLRAGHAPRRCPICGRWFLTTNAKPTKYCGGIAPNDSLGRTCRLIANKQGKAAREKADDNPINTICKRVIASIDQQAHRGKLDHDTANALKRKAREKRLKALHDCAYAQGSYEAEMTAAALLSEVRP